MAKTARYRYEIYISGDEQAEAYKQAAANLGLSLSQLFRQGADLLIQQAKENQK